MNVLTWPWLSEIVIIGWRDFKNHKRPPYPSELLASFVIFGLLSVVASNEDLAKASNVFGWGVVIATFFKLVDPSFASTKPQFNIPQGPTNPVTGVGPQQTGQ